MAAHLRSDLRRRNAAVLSPATLQPFLRGASRRLVCPESSRRGFRGDVCDLAYAGAGLARALQGVEGATEAGIRGRINALAGRQTTGSSAGIPCRRSRLPQRQAQDSLRAEAQTLRGFVSRLLRQ